MADRPPSVARRARQTVHLWVESLRDMLTSVGPVLLFALALLAAAYWWLDPQPPRTVTLATGPAGSAYAEFGQRYAQALARDGIEVQLLASDGPASNLQALREGRADVAFVRGGSDSGPESDLDEDEDPNEGILSLGALFYEPLWIFYRPAALHTEANPATRKGAQDRPAALTSLSQLQGLRINLDEAGSGVPELMRRLLLANGLGPTSFIASELPPKDAAEALKAGQIDALVLMTAPESPTVQRLLLHPGIALAEVPQPIFSNSLTTRRSKNSGSQVLTVLISSAARSSCASLMVCSMRSSGTASNKSSASSPSAEEPPPSCCVAPIWLLFHAS